MGQASNSSFVWECVPESYHFLSEDRQWHLSITLERQGLRFTLSNLFNSPNPLSSTRSGVGAQALRGWGPRAGAGLEEAREAPRTLGFICISHWGAVVAAQTSSPPPPPLAPLSALSRAARVERSISPGRLSQL